MINEHKIMLLKLNVMIFFFSAKWLVMLCKFNVMFFLCRIMLPRLEFNLGCGAIFVFEKAYYKNGTARVLQADDLNQ
jgi:hypothetical protein